MVDWRAYLADNPHAVWEARMWCVTGDLRKVRKMLGWTQAATADAVSAKLGHPVARSTPCRWERFRREPRFQEALALHAVFRPHMALVQPRRDGSK